MIPSKRTNLTTGTTKIASDNVTVEDQSHIAEIFNRYFVEICQLLAHNANTHDNTDFRSFLKNSVSDLVFLVLPKSNKIYNAINTLNIHKTCEYDNILSYFLRLEVLAPFLSQYFGYFFILGTFPECFKVAKVIHIFFNQQTNIKSATIAPYLSFRLYPKFLKN